MYRCEGRFCVLEELSTSTEKLLFEIMSEFASDYRLLVSDEEIPKTLELFKRKVAAWFEGGRVYQFVIQKSQAEEVVGTIFFYGYQSSPISMKCSAFFVPKVRKSVLVAEALGLSLCFAREVAGIEEVLFSVYLENSAMHAIGKKIGAIRKELTLSAMNSDRKVVTYHLTSETLDSLIQKVRRLNR